MPGAGKSELIESYAIKDVKRTVTFQISGPFNRLGLIERLIQLKLQRYHALYIDIGTVSDPFDLDIFLFQLIVFGYVSSGSTAYALTCDKIYIEIANSIQNTLCDALSTVASFPREHMKWKNYEDLKVSMEINSPMQVVCRFLKELDEDSLDDKDLFFNGPDAVKALTKLECKTIYATSSMLQTEELETLLIDLTREPDTYVPNKIAYEFRNTYVLTADNLLKMILISLRINTMIPVIIMGETGCGKTSLIQYLSKMCGIELNIFSIHAGTSEDEIYSRIWYTSQKALSNLNKISWLFLDEINTCEHLGLIASTICHRFCKDFKLAPNLAILAACNPY
ncbi:RNF213 [Mytilus edulis]|uniref:RNF213 n=1 Tax=Mytilus edulis TaxID=6550 RepID=A0A8S3Q4H9_MYTED|nr:RNF213 [Mytilus edulis]